ncbi:hypothetical protein N9L97_01220 [Cyclobacteriaceae bacterium]|nr:hypothetical protein [Cyclobacteriaceae bacterium]
MKKQHIFKSIEGIQKSIGNSSDCELYSGCSKNVKNSWDQIYLIEKIRLKSSFNLKKSFKENNSSALLFLIRMNAKFRFGIVRKFFELLHLVIEIYRLNLEINSNSQTKLIEDKIFEEDDSLVFYPSLKKSLKNIVFLNLIKKTIKRKKNINYPKTLLFHSSLHRPRNIEMLIVKSCIKKLESVIIKSNIKEIYVGGSMNMFNRIITLMFLKNNLVVIYKDHGFVRDCCAQYGIFSKAIPFQKHAIKASIEKHISYV